MSHLQKDQPDSKCNMCLNIGSRICDVSIPGNEFITHFESDGVECGGFKTRCDGNCEDCPSPIYTSHIKGDCTLSDVNEELNPTDIDDMSDIDDGLGHHNDIR